MSSYIVIRQLEEKNVAQEIDKLLWSNQMDLIALSNFKGEVSLHRLTWTKAWTFQPPVEGELVQALCWRPDGKILAIAYNDGQILLLSVENKVVLYSFKVNGHITCISWMQEKKKKVLPSLQNEDKTAAYTEYVDYSSEYLPQLPSLSNFSTSNGNEETYNNFFHYQSSMNVLVIGTNEGDIHMSIFGSLNCAILNISEFLGMKCTILKVYMSEHLDKMNVIVRDATGSVQVVLLDTTLFRQHSKELFCLALKKLELSSIITYLDTSIGTIKESWEKILMEMDSKLSSYASKVAPGTLSTDFFELLMFGSCCEEMQEFLLRDLTKKGLEKFGQTMEISYTNIQKLLLKHISHGGQSVTYHLAELRGMAKLESRFKALGLEEAKVTKAIEASNSFLLKSAEMQQIINNSLIYYKAFFRWLYITIYNLIQETVPPEIPKLSEMDLKYIAEFIQCFDQIGAANSENSGENSIMERLGQYLANDYLKFPSNVNQSDWNTFLDQNECIKNHPNIIKHHKELSLVQQLKFLEMALAKIFENPEIVIRKSIEFCKSVLLKDTELITGIDTIRGTFLYAFVNSSRDGFSLIELNGDSFSEAKAVFLYIRQPNGQNYKITDLEFYTESTISLLLTNKDGDSVLGQCSLSVLRERMQLVNLELVARENLLRADATDYCQLKNIGMSASKFSVSGSRRVAVVLAENKKKVMLFEMEGEEEEEDADMTNSTVKESDASMQGSDAD